MPKKPELSDADQALRESIGASIRAASVKGNCKPGDIADAGGVSLAHQYRIENGERTADVLYIVKVARRLGISVDELIHAPAAASAPKRRGTADQSQENDGKGAVQIDGDVTGSSINTGSGSSVQVKQKKSLFSVAIGSVGKK